MRLADRDVEVADLKQHPDRYTGLFGRARSEVGHAVCLCRRDEVVRLVIRCRSGRYHLANWPAGGRQHAPGCKWYRSPSSTSGRSTYEPAINANEEGTSIRLSAQLTIHGVSTDPPTTHVPVVAKPGASEPATTTQRRSMGLLAFLHYLWESSQLNVWHPRTGRRDWRACRSLLVEQARDCRVNRRDLAETLWIVPPFQSEYTERINAAWDCFLDRLSGTGRTRRRGLVLGQIRQITPTKYGLRIGLAHQRAPLYASQQLMDRCARSYPAALGAHASEAGHQVVLCLIERTRRGHPVIQDLAAMLTTTSYVPADSSHEAEMADALAAAGRAFVKPLNYDGGGVHPDFVLVDEPETYVEVWGVRGREDYEARKRTKQELYRESGTRLLEWDVRDPLPDLSGKKT